MPFPPNHAPPHFLLQKHTQRVSVAKTPRVFRDRATMRIRGQTHNVSCLIGRDTMGLCVTTRSVSVSEGQVPMESQSALTISVLWDVLWADT